jgi:hypothetical protein
LLERYNVKFNPKAVSHQRYVVTPRQHMRQWFQAGKADVAFARKHPGRARELFELHGAASWRVRLLFRPIAKLPFIPNILAGVAVRLAEGTAGAPPLFEQWIARFFFAAREILYWSGVRSASRREGRRDILVLCYHAIADLRADPILAEYGIGPADFASQLDDLRERGFTFIGADDLHNFIESGAALPPRSVLLSFDDCYAEHSGACFRGQRNGIGHERMGPGDRRGALAAPSPTPAAPSSRTGSGSRLPFAQS